MKSVAACAFLLVSLLGPDAFAFRQETTRYAAPLRLAVPNIAVSLDGSVPGLPDGGQAAVLRGAARWATPSCSQLGGPDAGASPSVPVQVRWVAADTWPHGASEAARTTLDADPRSGWIRAATIELNGRYAFIDRDGAMGATSQGELDLSAVITHEVGHAIGLAHSPDRNATMRAGRRSHEHDLTELGSDDVSAVCTLYPRSPVASAGDPPSPAFPTRLLLVAPLVAGAALYRARARSVGRG